MTTTLIRRTRTTHPVLPSVLAALTLVACGGGGSSADSGPTATVNAAARTGEKAYDLVPLGPNVVSTWHAIAIDTINVPSSPTGATPEERVGGPDIATVQVAVYDAVIAIAATHRPFATTPTTPAAGASAEAAVVEAAYRALKGLFPSRGDKYEAAHTSALAAIADGDAKARGLSIGAEAAAGALALRANDGRSVALAPFVPGTASGDFRGVNPVNRQWPFIRPFTLRSADQFRPEPPPALSSDVYTRDFDESKAMGGTVSSLRTAEQLDLARFHTESPAVAPYRNQRRFATVNVSLADNARLLAILSVALADATIGCFDAKYHYGFWRPTSAITLADTDGNAATTADPAWTPVVPTPNHPEYPAAHGCVSSATAESLREFYGTKKLSFDWDSTVASAVQKTRHYDSTDAFLRDIVDARVYGGMHYRNSGEAGVQLGRKTAQWVMRYHFEAK
ncbi:vanadium-dependent haloperoxidase [Rhizobacter sp. Root404]|uniref:vanadium-dependent haloperoxidase n=1 Tax=Rhizobacter sp. Root404 TaxID=1736528 RepID=UPI000ABCD95F|nr:vanadium-dependent haloperoxidase [Rhizobacter sp. Root404]